MQEMYDNDVLEQNDNVVCAGGVVLVKGQKKGTYYCFCTEFCKIDAVLQQKVYLLPDIPQLIDQSCGCDLWSLLDLKFGFYNVPVAAHACK